MSCTLHTSTPSLNPQNRVFWACKTSCEEIRNLEIFHTDHHRDTDSHLLFQKWLKSVQDKWPKGRVAFLSLPEKKNIFEPFGGTLGQFPQFFYVILHCRSSLSLGYIPNYVQICSDLGSYSRQTLPRPATVIAMGSVESR